MLCIQIKGGLGNQMFQYAFAKSISEKYQVPFIIDCNYFEIKGNVDYTLWDFELNVFQLKVNKAEVDQLKKYKVSLLSKINARLNKLLNIPVLFKNSRVTEEQFDLKFYDESFNPKNKYFVGYWQSEYYFNSIEQIIREDFKFKPSLDEKNLSLKKRIKTSNSVSVHIRRGDYVNNPSAFKNHGVCSIEYYRKSIEEIKKQVDNPVFFFFSDDFEWVRENNFGIQNYEFIDWNQEGESYIDMQMMSYCKHNIIANSSFSWWGAWLNNNPYKNVIAPRKWFADDIRNKDSEKIIPKKWKRI